MAGNEGQRSATASRLRWLLVVGLLVYNLVLLALEAIAAAVGGELSDWGSGAVGSAAGPTWG